MSSQSATPVNRFRQLRLAVHFVIMIVLVVAVTPVTHFVLTLVFRLPDAGSEEAVAIDVLFRGHYWMIAILFSLIVVMMLYSLFTFRARPGDYSAGADFHGNLQIELAWIAIPTVIVILFGYWGFVVLGDINAAEPDEMVLEVTGFQFGWSFVYPEMGGLGSGTTDLPISTVYLPEDRQIKLEMNSRDVLHAFWVPEFRVKQDLVPGQTTVVRITPTTPGEYKIQCAEVCGPAHYSMIGTIMVLTQAEFDSWAAAQMAAAAQ